MDRSARLCRPRGAYFLPSWDQPRQGLSLWDARMLSVLLTCKAPWLLSALYPSATRHPAPVHSIRTAWRSLLQSSGGPGDDGTPRDVTHICSVEKARRTMADGAQIYRLPPLARSKDRFWRHWCFLTQNRHSEADYATVNSHRRTAKALSP